MTDKFWESWTKSIYLNQLSFSLLLYWSCSLSVQTCHKRIGAGICDDFGEPFIDLIACWEQLSCNCVVEWGCRSGCENAWTWFEVTQGSTSFVWWHIQSICAESPSRLLQIPNFQFRQFTHSAEDNCMRGPRCWKGCKIIKIQSRHDFLTWIMKCHLPFARSNVVFLGLWKKSSNVNRELVLLNTRVEIQEFRMVLGSPHGNSHLRQAFDSCLICGQWYTCWKMWKNDEMKLWRKDIRTRECLGCSRECSMAIIAYIILNPVAIRIHST